jgi:Domain of unknown function (DUF4172)
VRLRRQPSPPDSGELEGADGRRSPRRVYCTSRLKKPLTATRSGGNLAVSIRSGTSALNPVSPSQVTRSAGKTGAWRPPWPRQGTCQGRLVGQMEALGFKVREEAVLRTLTEDVLKSSEIEGEKLDADDLENRWEYQAEEALTLLGALHVNKRSLDVFEDLAREMGSRHWERAHDDGRIGASRGRSRPCTDGVRRGRPARYASALSRTSLPVRAVGPIRSLCA